MNQSGSRSEQNNISQGQTGFGKDFSDLGQQEVQTEIEKYFERLTLALDAARMGSWYWDSFTNKNIWTPYHDVIFGYEPGNGEHTYEDWSSRVHPDDLELAEAAWKTALEERVDYICEYRIVLPDSTLRWGESYGRYYYDDGGKPLRMAGTVTDITERKKAEQALQESQRRYSTLAQVSPVGIYRCNTSANLVYVNQRWCDITGYTFDRVINQEWRFIIYPGDKERVEAQVERALEEKINFGCEFRFQRPDNSLVWVFAVGICHADNNGKFIRVNQKFCDILGYSREELLELTFHEITYPADLESDLHQVRNLLSGKVKNFSMEKRYLCKDGSVIWVEITVSFVRQINGEPDYFLGVINDISQRKQAQTQLLLTETTAQLRKRNSELDQFAYVASHDLKAPLRAIANLSQWLEDDLLDSLEPDNLRHLELLRQRVYRMEALINGLLQYSRIGRVQDAEEKVDVNQLLAEIINDLAPPENFTIQVKDTMPTLTTKGMLLR